MQNASQLTKAELRLQVLNRNAPACFGNTDAAA
jgi:hypothetical protein